MSMKIKYNEEPVVENEGNRKETTSTSVVFEDAERTDLDRVLREHSGLDVEITIKFKEPKES